jgi:putative DNA primase/helicase
MKCEEHPDIIEEIVDSPETGGKSVNGSGEQIISGNREKPSGDPKVSEEEQEKAIDDLAALSAAGYDRCRDEVALRLGLRVSTLDKLVKERRDEIDAATGIPSIYPWWDVEPWAEKVDGDVLLRALVERIQRHVILSAERANAVALWILFTWVHERAAIHSPLLLVTSAEANSGKSTLLGVIQFLVRRSLVSISITGPALFRSIDLWQPTFMIDEADSAFVNNDDLREVTNSGWTRGQAAIRCDPDTHEPRPYSTFCPKTIGMKGRKLPDTTLSRSIIIEMKRKLPGETTQDFAYVDDEGLAQLRQKAMRWADDNADALAAATPAMPPEFHNRVRANWIPLFAIAEQAGGEWPERALKAARALEGLKAGFDASVGIRLLGDIRAAFAAEGVDRLTTKHLLELLAKDEERPWADWKNGKRITDRQLADLLKQYGVHSKNIRLDDGRTPKGYELKDFEDAFKRYLDSPKREENSTDAEPSPSTDPQEPESGFSSATPPQPNNGGHKSPFSHPPQPGPVAAEKSEKPQEYQPCGVVAAENPKNGSRVSNGGVSENIILRHPDQSAGRAAAVGPDGRWRGTI